MDKHLHFKLFEIYPHFHFSRLVCWLMWLHAIVLMIGGHYTYANVPLFNWVRDYFHLARNDYDRVGHFMQGFVPALISREVLLRRGVLKRGYPMGYGYGAHGLDPLRIDYASMA